MSTRVALGAPGIRKNEFHWFTGPWMDFREFYPHHSRLAPKISFWVKHPLFHAPTVHSEHSCCFCRDFDKMSVLRLMHMEMSLSKQTTDNHKNYWKCYEIVISEQGLKLFLNTRQPTTSDVHKLRMDYGILHLYSRHVILTNTGILSWWVQEVAGYLKEERMFQFKWLVNTYNM